MRLSIIADACGGFQTALNRARRGTLQSHEVRRYFASFGYKAQSWNKWRHVVAKVEWHPRVGFIVTNLARSAEGIVALSSGNAHKSNR
jgi:hypothetical protein